MQTKTTFKFLSATLISLILTACGGGSGSALDNTLNGGNTNTTSDWRFGNGLGTSFISGSIGTSIVDGSGVLYVGGTAKLTVNIVNETGILITDLIPVSFSSACINGGKSKIAEGAKVNSTTGSLTVQYQPSNCLGDDLVTATATYKGKTLSASGTVKISNIRLGLGGGIDFVPTKLDLGTNYQALYAGQTTTLSVNIVNDSGNSIQTSLPVTFTSGCINAGTSTITGGNIINSSSGTVKAEYKAGTCFGDDTVKASITYAGNIISASATIPQINNIRLGLGGGVDFIPTKLDLGSNYQALFADQTTTLSVNIVNDSGNPIQTSLPVTFTSDCINAGTSTITGGNVINSSSGTVKAEYKAGTCFGDDTVRASVTYAGNIISASATIPQVNNKRIGAGSGATFTPGLLTASTATTLFEGDTTQISANIVNNQSNLITQGNKVIFDSPCLSAGLATIAGGNIVNSIAGVARIQYKVGKCDIDDIVTATISNGSGNIDATISLPIDTRRIGSGFGSDFVESALELGIGAGSLSPGGSTTVTAYVVNSKGDLATDPLNITFTSPCLSAGNAVITGGNTVTSVNGKAIATYTSQGCAGVGGIDAIKASAPFRNIVLTANADLAVKSDTAQTISFVDANPKLISIKGTGGVETSVLRFRVLGQGGSPLKGICVNFAPSTTLGGLALVPSKCNPAGPETYGSTTDANGYASTTVQAGTVATAVRVTAVTANGISTQSSALAVSTGIPDQNSMTISLTDIEPIAWDYNGVQSTVTIRMADAFNNPVPDDTIVAFTTNGGSIQPNCPTKNGLCSVTWTSQSPKPISPNKVSFDSSLNMVCPAATDAAGNAITECRSGRIQILATAIGNESFIDGNGNGLYDDVSVDTFVTHSASDAADPNRNACNPSTPQSSAALGTPKGCDDLPEAYLDTNFNSSRTSIEEFIDFDQNGIYSSTNGKYDGALCAGAAKANGLCTSNKVTVRDDITLVMSCQTPFTQNGLMPGMPSKITVGQSESLKPISILRADCNGNGMPAGTTVSVDTSSLKDGTATVTPSLPSAMSREPDYISLEVKSAEGKTASGNIKLSITAPAGITGGAVTRTFTIPVN